MFTRQIMYSKKIILRFGRHKLVHNVFWCTFGFCLAIVLMSDESFHIEYGSTCAHGSNCNSIASLFHSHDYSYEDKNFNYIMPWLNGSAKHTDAFYWKRFSIISRRNKFPVSNVKNPRLLCWLMTDPDILLKSLHAQRTWLSRCDVPLIFSSQTDTKFPTIGLKAAAGRRSIAAKSHKAWEHVYEHYRDTADFFLKADPDSYVFVDNLKRYLTNYTASRSSLFGHALFFNFPQRRKIPNFSGLYAAGEAVVLSREALVKLNSVIDVCPLINGTGEDLKTCICLSMTGVRLTDTRDFRDRETFLPPFPIINIAADRLPSWYTVRYRKPFGYCSGYDCLSPHPVVTHYVKATEMYIFEYMARSMEELIKENAEGPGMPHYRFKGAFHHEIPLLFKQKPFTKEHLERQTYTHDSNNTA